MKTTREIIDALDGLDVKVHLMRSPPEPWERDAKAWVGPWAVSITAKRDGVTVEVGFERGQTVDAALAKAWAKFEPASTAGLPPAPALAAPTPAFEDADLVDDNEAIPF